jgi:hypothetical protein
LGPITRPLRVRTATVRTRSRNLLADLNKRLRSVEVLADVCVQPLLRIPPARHVRRRNPQVWHIRQTGIPRHFGCRGIVNPEVEIRLVGSPNKIDEPPARIDLD